MEPKKKTGGRQKGTPNKDTQYLIDVCKRMGHDPVEFYVNVVKGNWEKVGLDSKTNTFYTKSGDSYEQDQITVDHRLAANAKLFEYMFPKRKAVEISNSNEGQGFFTFQYVKPKPTPTPKKEEK